MTTRKLKGAEINCFTTEKELLPIVWALQKFRTYLAGAKIMNKTDHMATTFLKTCNFASARLMRWIKAIQDYQITVEHCQGKDNVVADTSSRAQPGKEWEKEEREERHPS